MDSRMLSVPAGWRAPIDSWGAALRAAGRAGSTVATRLDHLRRCARGLGGAPGDVTVAVLVGWCGGQVWARETRRSVYASLRGFWRWAVGVGVVDVDPTVGLPSVPVGVSQRRPAPDAVVLAGEGRADGRTRLILRLAALAGLRRVEIARVHARDLVEDLAGWSLVAHGKGGKDRWVPLSSGLGIEVRQACVAGGGWAFPGDDEGHLSPRWVGTLAARVLPDHWTLHTLRHRFATRAYAATQDLLAVQRLLGHSSPVTTQRYVATDEDRLRVVAFAAA